MQPLKNTLSVFIPKESLRKYIEKDTFNVEYTSITDSIERQKYLKKLYKKMEQNQENFSIVELWGRNFKGRTLKNSELNKSMH